MHHEYQGIYPENTDIRHLGHSETLLLMTVRLWVLAYRFPERQLPDWRSGLLQMGMTEAEYGALDKLMNILRSYSLRMMDIRCTCSRHLGSDESLLLHMVALLQTHRHLDTQRILSDWLPLPLQGMALMHAIYFSESLKWAGININGNTLTTIQQQPSRYPHLN